MHNILSITALINFSTPLLLAYCNICCYLLRNTFDSSCSFLCNFHFLHFINVLNEDKYVFINSLFPYVFIFHVYSLILQLLQVAYITF